MTDTPDPQVDNAADAAAETTYRPDTVEANHGREQGLGMGQRDLDAQRDAGGEADAGARPAPPLRQPDDPFPRIQADEEAADSKA